jgi:alpha/beta superfamily hydrolase
MSEELTLRRGSHEINLTLYGKSSQGVLLCPPHPKYGGNREDFRLVTIANELAGAGLLAACLDYSAYTGGASEIEDVLFVLGYLGKSLTSLGLLGYSYGAVVAANAATRFQPLSELVLISPLVKIDDLKIDLSSTCSKLVIYGLHDDLVTGNIDGLFDSAVGKKQRLSLDTDHFYAGYEAVLAHAVREFFQKTFQDLTTQN